MGYVIGYCASLPLIGMQIAGQLIDQQLGTAFASVVNPELGDQSSIVAEFLFYTSMAFFVIVGGHEAILAVLIGSFNSIPLGGFDNFLGLVELAIGLVQLMFTLAFRVAAPLLCLMFLLSVGMGFIARTVPQMNILSIGFALRILVGVGLFLAFLPVIFAVFDRSLHQTLQVLMRAFATA